jgi:hypothetical protein
VQKSERNAVVSIGKNSYIEFFGSLVGDIFYLLIAIEAMFKQLFVPNFV